MRVVDIVDEQVATVGLTYKYVIKGSNFEFQNLIILSPMILKFEHVLTSNDICNLRLPNQLKIRFDCIVRRYLYFYFVDFSAIGVQWEKMSGNRQTCF